MMLGLHSTTTKDKISSNQISNTGLFLETSLHPFLALGRARLLDHLLNSRISKIKRSNSPTPPEESK